MNSDNPCKGLEKCNLTKDQLCKEITKNYIVRSNIVAAILTAIPDEENKDKNICYQELRAIEDCKICLPPNFDNLEKMEKDERIIELLKYVSKLSKKKCLEVNGVYREYTDEEKNNLKINNNKYNRYYLAITLQMKQEYHSSLLQLIEILNLLNTEVIITNKDINKIGRKTKEILDIMYSNCQFNYLNAIWALLKADISSHEETEEDIELESTLKSAIRENILERFVETPTK